MNPEERTYEEPARPVARSGRGSSACIQPPARRGGRPRDPRADQAILEAARQLLAEAGYAAMSMEQVARRAGVGKDTLYRRWPSKLALVRDGILRPAVGAVHPGSSEDPRDDLVTYLTEVADFAASTSFVKVVAGIIGEAFRNPEVAGAFREFVGGRRHVVEALLRELKQAEGLPVSSDLDLEIDLLLAPLYYRHLVTGEPVDRALFERIVNRVFPERNNGGGSDA